MGKAYKSALFVRNVFEMLSVMGFQQNLEHFYCRLSDRGSRPENGTYTGLV